MRDGKTQSPPSQGKGMGPDADGAPPPGSCWLSRGVNTAQRGPRSPRPAGNQHGDPTCATAPRRGPRPLCVLGQRVRTAEGRAGRPGSALKLSPDSSTTWTWTRKHLTSRMRHRSAVPGRTVHPPDPPPCDRTLRSDSTPMPTAVLVNRDGHVPGDQAGSPEGLCLYKNALTESSYFPKCL